jgi:uncharacterized protein YecE (DUF72 family)
VNVRVGTSGFAFKEWKGPFYPADLKDDGMLGFYAGKYPAVEINNTFYRLPKQHVLADWASRVHDDFTFSIKASRGITHFGRLKADSVATGLRFLLASTGTLGRRLGPILFQLPPDLRKDLDRLKAFLELLPFDRRFTIEFRHESWFDDAVFELLRAHDIALCVAESDELRCPSVATASWGYLRLHRQDYDDAMLEAWQDRVASHAWTDAYVFFKHDYIDGAGPLAVERFSSMMRASSGVKAPLSFQAEVRRAAVEDSRASR